MMGVSIDPPAATTASFWGRSHQQVPPRLSGSPGGGAYVAET